MWQDYREFVVGLHGPATFTEEQPYWLHEFSTLRVTAAALNSTILESHRDSDHYGWSGDSQLRWFEDKLRAQEGVLRIVMVHHNARRGETSDNEIPRDAGRQDETCIAEATPWLA